MLIKFFKLLPFPEINTAIFIFLYQLILSFNLTLFLCLEILPITYGLNSFKKYLLIFLNFLD